MKISNAFFFVVAVIGAAITLWGFFSEPSQPAYALKHDGNTFVLERPENSWHDKFLEWAPHFGPELLILFLAAGILDKKVEDERQKEAARQRHEREKNAAKQRVLERLRSLLRYVEDNSAFFTGDAIMTLQAERNQLVALAGRAKDIFASNELVIVDAILEYANELLGRAQSIKPDDWLMDGVRIKLGLFAASIPQISDIDRKTFAAIDDAAGTTLRIGVAAYAPESGVLEEQASFVLENLTTFIDGLAPRMAGATAEEDEIMERLSSYRATLKHLFQLKEMILKGAAGYRDDYDTLHAMVWAA